MPDGRTLAEAEAALEGFRDSVLDGVARMPSRDEFQAMLDGVQDSVLEEVRTRLTSAVPARDNHGRVSGRGGEDVE